MTEREVSLWQYLRGKYQRQEEIRDGLRHGSWRFPVLWLVPSVENYICRTELAKHAARTTDARFSKRGLYVRLPVGRSAVHGGMLDLRLCCV